jgi:hypothetical protein
MFVRWKTNPGAAKRNLIHSAVIVKSVYIDGESRQRFVKYLASIREDHIRLARLRSLFWAKVTKKLETLSLDSVTREAIERKIAKKVLKPPEEELIDQQKKPYDLRVRAKYFCDQ